MDRNAHVVVRRSARYEVSRAHVSAISHEEGFLPQDLLYMLQCAIYESSRYTSVSRCPDNDSQTLWASAASDIKKFHHLLSDATYFAQKPQSKSRLGRTGLAPASLEHSSIQIDRDGVRVAMKTQKAFDRGKGLHEFRSKLCMVPKPSAASRQAIIAEVCQIMTPFGILSLPPTISFIPVIRSDAEVFNMIDQDDVCGLRRLLLSGQASVRACDQHGRGLIHRAAWNGSAEIFALLIAQGADIDSLTALSSSALLLCCGVDYLCKMRLALEAGADPTLLPNGQFNLATMGVDVVKTIMRTSSACIDLKLRNPQGRTLLLVTAATASNQDQASIMRMLLRAGAGITDVDDDGESCLHLFMRNVIPEHAQALESLEVMLRTGADVSETNDMGLDVLDIACQTSEQDGSFKRDLLRRALLSTGVQVQDERLDLPSIYTATYSATWFMSNLSGQPLTSMRGRLLTELTDDVDCGSVYTRRKLHETATDRVLLRFHGSSVPAFEQLKSMTLQYLRRMVVGKQQLVLMITQRLPYQAWIPYAKGMAWFKINEDSELTALLDFDWSLPVDPEDLFATYIDSVAQHVEVQKEQQPQNSDLDALLKVLEGAVPSFQAMSKRRAVIAGTTERLDVVETVDTTPIAELSASPEGRTSAAVAGISPVSELSASPVDTSPRSASTSSSPVQHKEVGNRSELARNTCTVQELSAEPMTDRPRRDSLSPERQAARLSILKTPVHFYSQHSFGVNDGQDTEQGAKCQGAPVLGADDMHACLAAGQASRAGRRGRKGRAAAV